MKKLSFSITCLVFLLTTFNCHSKAYGSDFNVFLKGASKEVICTKVSKIRDEIDCSEGKVLTVFSDSMVEKILFKGETIYPYASNTKLSIDDIKSGNCAHIKAAIVGPILLENNEHFNFLYGKMLEQGICVNVNLDLAKAYYLKGGIEGREAYDQIPHKSIETTKVDKMFVDNLQKDSDQQRMLQARLSQRCQKQCSLNSIESQFRYSTQCYNDCMSN